MNKGAKTAGLLLLGCCVALAAYAGVSAVLDTLNRGEILDIALKPQASPQTTQAPPETGVELNTATREELMGLPGIGEHLADEIIAQREANPFYFLEDLKVVSGIGDNRVEALRGLAWVRRVGTEGTATPAP